MPRISTRSRKPNVAAATILAMTAGILYANFDPVPAGEAPESSSIVESSSEIEFIVPMPPEAACLPVVESTVDTPDPVQPPVTDSAPLLTNTELIEYSMLLMKDGAQYLKQFDTYTTVLHKQERLGGDLSEVQIIDLKVRQSTPFAVYMKWRNGDRGRQLLYSDEYADGDMVVKLGGFKGRLLPGIKLNPHGSRAKQEARRPATQAGILRMVEQMIVDRQEELAAGHGIQCSRLPNPEFDQRDCVCFVFEYASPQDSKDYRKRLIVLDAKHHFPVLARNYTWAAECDDLSPEELDALTLVENYSFIDINFSKTLTAMDFSRENRRYRM